LVIDIAEVTPSFMTVSDHVPFAVVVPYLLVSVGGAAPELRQFMAPL
jgi:hypothetical protein